MRIPRSIALITALNVLFVSRVAPAADVAPRAREILSRSQGSLISISALCKLDLGAAAGISSRLGALAEAQEASCIGLVIDASGLTVASYSALNPMERVAGAIKVRVGSDGDTLKVKTDLSRIQMRLDDGTDVPGRMVLKDKELDLAFIIPDPKEGETVPPFTPLKLSPDGVAKELDDVVAISRHAKDLGYQPIVTVGQVSSVVKKPRTMYDLSVAPRAGSPVYLPDGRLLGLTVAFGGEGLGSSAREMLVLPASEVVKLADQARKAVAKIHKDGKQRPTKSEK
jgi:hypothetical protein